MTGLLAFAILFLLFVAARNGLNISLDKFPDQVAYAFTGEGDKELPPEIRGLDATARDQQLVEGEKERRFLVVTGDVVNNAGSERSKVMIEGRLVDPRGEVRATLQVPCRKVFTVQEIRETPKGEMMDRYMAGSQPFDCRMKTDETAVFQMVFEDPPADYSASYKVEVQTVSASFPE
jgi:hypothetical protein